MNYLAHLYLSGQDEEILIGNFIGDYVKGHNFRNYSEKIKSGILLHRNIDMFTDTNTIVRASKSRFTEKYGKYSGILIDILYDHFLTVNWHKFTSYNINRFVVKVHKILDKYFESLPPEVQQFIPSFINNNWLVAYQSVEGIEVVLQKMSRRTSLPDHTEYAIHVLRDEYDFLDEEFMTYFPLLIEFVRKKFNVELI